MGWAKRWMKALLRSKKDVRDRRDAASYSGGEERRDRKSRSFARPRQESAVDGALTPANALEQAGSQRTCYANNSEDSERAIAVAMATAAAADTAVIAAHAAMARLQCLAHGRTVTILWAAINIQKAYRGYLARKALRALKALVKLQALIRGQIVRKQAAATLKQLEALVRVQAFSLHRRSHHFPEEGRRRMRQEYFPRRSFEKASACEARIKYLAAAQSQGSDRSPKVVEVDTCQHQSRSFHATSSYMLHQHEELKQISSPRKLNLTLRQIRCSQDFDCHDADSVKGRYPKTTQNTPRLPSANLTESPRATDDILERLLNRTDYPSYMASTRSFAAKVRSHSMAKAGLETPRLKNRIASGQMIESSASLIGNGTGRNLKVGGEGRLDKSLDLCSEAARDYYLDTMW